MKIRIAFFCALFCSGLCVAQTGVISTYAGTGTTGISGDGGAATSSALSSPFAWAVDTNGNLFFIDLDSSRVRRVDAASGIITTVAGGGTGGDGGLATSAGLSPVGGAVDAAGNLYAADNANNRIRRIDAASGIITTIAGTGAMAYNGDGIAGTTANLNLPLMYSSIRAGI